MWSSEGACPDSGFKPGPLGSQGTVFSPHHLFDDTPNQPSPPNTLWQPVGPGLLKDAVSCTVPTVYFRVVSPFTPKGTIWNGTSRPRDRWRVRTPSSDYVPTSFIFILLWLFCFFFWALKDPFFPLRKRLTLNLQDGSGSFWCAGPCLVPLKLLLPLQYAEEAQYGFWMKEWEKLIPDFIAYDCWTSFTWIIFQMTLYHLKLVNYS